MARKKKGLVLHASPGNFTLTGGDVTLGITTVSQPTLTEQPRGTAQPRGMETLEEQKAQPYFMASMEVELQKFGKTEYSQLLLGEDAELQKASITYGLDLTEYQDRALHAIQKLLADTDYLGNLQGENRISTEFKWSGYLPTLSFSPTEFYDACPGLERAGDGRYHGAQAKMAMDALKGLLDKKYSFSYNRQVFKDGKPVYKDGKKSYEAVRAVGPLIYQVGEIYADLTEEELRAEESGQELPDTRKTRISITPSPILLAGINRGWYLLKPARLHDEVKALYQGRNYPREVSLFLEWLLTLNKREMSIGRRPLAVKLRMDYLLKNRKQALIDKKITEALDVAQKLGYLLSYEVQPTGLITMKLNPERIKRINGKAEKEAG